MRKRRQRIILIILSVVMAAIVVHTIVKRVKSNNANVTLSDHQAKDQITNYNKKDAGYYTDYYNGYKFKIGSDYSAKTTTKVQGETIIYPNSVNANGCVFVLTYTDTTALTLVDEAYLLIPVKSELKIYMDNKFDSIEGYDYGIPQYGTVGDKEVATEIPKIRYDQQWMKSEIYHFSGEHHEQVVVGYVAKDTPSEAILKKEAQTIVKTFTFYDAGERAEYQGSNVSNADLINTAHVGNITFNYPRKWRAVYPTVDRKVDGRQSLIFKASRAKNSLFEDAGLYVAEDNGEGESGTDLKFNYALTHRDGIGASVLQYPDLIEPNITVIYDKDETEDVNIQGEKSKRYSISIHVNAEDQELDVPYNGIVYRNAYLYTLDRGGKSYIFVFSYNGMDRFTMKKLSKKIMDTVIFPSSSNND